MVDDTKLTEDPAVPLPGVPAEIQRHHPQLWRAFQELGMAASAAGPLDQQTRRLVHLAIALAGDSEGATHSHTRRALAEGISAEELEHVPLLAITTLGWPRAMKGLSWVRDVTRSKD